MSPPPSIPPARFDASISSRLDDDRDLVKLLARIGPRVDYASGGGWEGEGHRAMLDLAVDRPMRLHVRLEPVGALGRRQAVRFALGPVRSAASEHAPGLELPWVPILEVAHDQRDRWVASRRFGAWSRGDGRSLGYQGWWQPNRGAACTDVSTRLFVHARHARGSVLWLGSRTDHDAPGETHKNVIAVLVDADD